MLRVRLNKGRKHVQFDIPGRGGALHLRRGRVGKVTREELDWLQVNAADVYAGLEVLPTPHVPKRTARKLAAAQPEPAPAKPSRRKAKAKTKE